MCYIIGMSRFFPVFLCGLVFGSAVTSINPWNKTKTKPDHVGIVKEIQGFETMYSLEASLHGIYFKNHVSIGFSLIKNRKGKGTVVGLCTYGKKFREIDVDLKYWNESTWTTKRTLIYHEMTHCFCGRLHTFKNGILDEFYPDAEDIKPGPFYMIQPGYLADGCPMSIMYPYVLGDDCVKSHWDLYDNEMFEGCSPY